MNGEISILGVFLPTLLLLAVIASAVTMVLLRLVEAAGLYRFVAYRALVDLCLYVLVFAALYILVPYFGLRS